MRTPKYSILNVNVLVWTDYFRTKKHTRLTIGGKIELNPFASHIGNLIGIITLGKASVIIFFGTKKMAKVVQSIPPLR